MACLSRKRAARRRRRGDQVDGLVISLMVEVSEEAGLDMSS